MHVRVGLMDKREAGVSNAESFSSARQDPWSGLKEPVGFGLIAAGTAFGYYVCALIGTLLSVPPSGFAIIWPATAFLISIFLITPPKHWWLCVAGVVPTHFYLAATMQSQAPLVVVLTQVAGNLALALATVIAVRIMLGRRPMFGTLNSVLTFILIAGICTPAIVNTLVIGVHVATGWVSDFWLSWRQWFIAGIFPTITIPIVFVLASTGKLAGHTEASHPLAELGLLSVLLFAFTYVAFGGGLDAGHWPVLFLVPFPLLLWAAVRLGVGGTSVSLLILAAATIAQALRHNGPFAVQSPIEDIISLQTYLVTTSIPLLLVAALMDERRKTGHLLQLSEARMQMAASATDTGLWQWDACTREFWITDHCRKMFGLKPASDLTLSSFLKAIAPEDRTRMRKAIKSALVAGNPPRSEEYRVDACGQTRWLLLSTHSEFDNSGRPLRISGAFRDITDRKVAQLDAERLREKIVRLRDDERRRIAEELHDSTAQHLVAASLSLVNLETRFDVAGARSMLSDAMQSVREASQEIRTFSYLLHPPQLSSVGLCGVLRQYVPGFESRTGVHASLRVSALIDRLPTAQQHAILRIAQESLGNVHRHARASNVWVSVRCISGNVHLVVRDDGKGIESKASEELGNRLKFGVGMPAMAARVRRLNGRMDVNSRSKGTTIHVVMPLPGGLAGSLH